MDDHTLIRKFDRGDVGSRGEHEIQLYYYKKHSPHTEGYLHLDIYLHNRLNGTLNLTRCFEIVYDVRMELNTWPQRDPKTRYRQYKPLHEIMDHVRGEDPYFRIIKIIHTMDMFLSLSRTQEELNTNCSDRALEHMEYQNLYSYNSATNVSLDIGAEHFPYLGRLIVQVMREALGTCAERFKQELKDAVLKDIRPKFESLFHAQTAIRAFLFYARKVLNKAGILDDGMELEDMNTKNLVRFFYKHTRELWDKPPLAQLDRDGLTTVLGHILDSVEEETGEPRPERNSDRFRLMITHFIEPCKMVYRNLRAVFESERRFAMWFGIVSERSFRGTGYNLHPVDARLLFMTCQPIANVHHNYIAKKMWPNTPPMPKPEPAWPVKPKFKELIGYGEDPRNILLGKVQNRQP